MKAQGIIGLIVAVVVIAGGVWFFSSKSPATPSGSEGTSAANGSGTFASLMAMAGSVKCSVATVASTTQSSGTVYVSDGQMRGDFNSTTKATGETVIESHLIRAGGYMYTWSSAAPQGIKMSDAVITQASSGQSAPKGGVDPNAQVTYSCLPWAADAAQFVPPSNVTFMDVSAMMKNMPGAMPVKGTTYPAGTAGQPYNY